MNKPISIKVMQFVSYFKIALFFVGLSTLKLDELKADAGMYVPFLIFSLLSMIYMIVAINKKKFFLSIVFAFINFLFSVIMNPFQQLASLLVMLLFVLKPTRDYLRRDHQALAKEGNGEAAADSELSTEEETADTGENGKSTDNSKLEIAALDKPKPKLRKDPEVSIREATPEDADTVYSLMMIAFEEYRTAIPPSSALEETEEAIKAALSDGSESAAILFEDDTATAMARFTIEGDALYFFRLSVIPSRRRRGHARKLVQWLERHAISKGLNASKCKVRQSVQNNLVLYQNMGYEIVDQELVVRPAGTVKTLKMEKKLGV